MEEFTRGGSKEVIGYFPTYLRQLFLQDHDPAQLPPLPAAVSRSAKGGPEAPKSEPFKLDLAMDAQGMLPP